MTLRVSWMPFPAPGARPADPPGHTMGDQRDHGAPPGHHVPAARLLHRAAIKSAYPYNLRSRAIEPGSRILIVEKVIPARGCYREAAMLSMQTWAKFKNRERTEKQWRNLIESTGGLGIWDLEAAGVVPRA